MDFLSYRCTSIEEVDGKPVLVWKWSSDPDWYSKIEPMRLVEKRRNQRRKKGLPPEPIPTSPLREMALYNRQQSHPDEAPAPAPSKKLTLKEAAKAAKQALRARKHQQRRKGPTKICVFLLSQFHFSLLGFRKPSLRKNACGTVLFPRPAPVWQIGVGNF